MYIAWNGTDYTEKIVHGFVLKDRIKKMRWQRKSLENERIRESFLIWPRCINEEYRWWEQAKWLQSKENAFNLFKEFSWWYDVRWLEKGKG